MAIENDTIKRLKKNLEIYDKLIKIEEAKLKTLINAKSKCQNMIDTEIYYIKNCKRNKKISMDNLLKRIHKKYYKRDKNESSKK